MLTEEQTLINRLSDKQVAAIAAGDTWGVNREEFDLWLAHRNDCTWMRTHFNDHQNVNADYKVFNNAHLGATNFKDSLFHSCRFINAKMWHSTFTNVDFSNSDFNSADLEQSEFINCDLKDCWFIGAALFHVQGLRVISGVGHHGRLIYAYVYNGEIRIQAGCRNDMPEAVREAIKYEYRDSVYLADYLGVVKLLENWGKLEIKRLKAKAKNKSFY
jgi:hypothetical protein